MTLTLQMRGWGRGRCGDSEGDRQAGSAQCCVLCCGASPARGGSPRALTPVCGPRVFPSGTGLAGSGPGTGGQHRWSSVHLGWVGLCVCHWGPGGHGAGWWPLKALEVVGLHCRLGSSQGETQASLRRILGGNHL